MARPSGPERLARLMALPAWVAAHPGATLAQAAQHFDVPPEQLHSDLDTLWMTGLPGMAGGDLVDFDFAALEEDDELYLTQGLGLERPVRLSRHEAASLLLVLSALRQGLAADPLTVKALERTRDALLEVMGEPSAAGCQPKGLAVPGHTDQASAPQYLGEVDPTVLGAVRQALCERRRLLLEYVSATDHRSSRQVDPLVLQGDGSHLTLSAWCHQAGAERSFRLDRVLEAQVLEAPATHQPPVRRRRAVADQHPVVDQHPVAVLTLAPTGRWLVEEIPCESATEMDDGRWRVEVRGRDEEWLVRLVLSAGQHVLQVEPPPLQARAAQVAREALQAYVQISETPPD